MWRDRLPAGNHTLQNYVHYIHCTTIRDVFKALQDHYL